MAKIMNWPDFEQKIGQSRMIIFTPLDLKRLFCVSETSIRFFLHRYVQKGLVIKLKRGLYCLRDHLPSDFLLANQLYQPSYLSFELALSYHHVIPETVYTITSATVKATREFSALGKSFYYHRIKKQVFTGYRPQKVAGQTILIAGPEKALVDYLHFVDLKKKRVLERCDLKKVERKKALEFAALYQSRSLIKLINEFYD